MRFATSALLLVLVAACATPRAPEAPPAVDTNAAFDRLADEYFEAALPLNPVQATAIGDNRFNDRYVAAFSDARRNEALALAKKYEQALRRIDPKTLDASRQVSHSILARELADTIEG